MLFRSPSNGGWQPDAYSFAWRSKDGLFSGVISNFQNFIRYVDTALQGIPTILLLLFAILTLSGTVLTGLVLIRQKKPLYQRILSLVYLLLLPIFVVLGAVGPLLVLRPSSFSISAHSLLCLCSLGIWAGMMISALYPRLPKLSPLLFLPCMIWGLSRSEERRVGKEC